MKQNGTYPTGDKSNTNVYKNPADSGEMSYEDYDKWKIDNGE